METFRHKVAGPACPLQSRLQNNLLDLTEAGKGLKVQTEKPHLVSLGSGRLSTAITLLPLEEGRTVLGSAAGDVVLQGPGVAPKHCFIENVQGTLTLHPCGNPCAIDGLAITRPTRLSQGCMICLGQSTFLRFNHPAEAKWMKSMIPGGGQGTMAAPHGLLTEAQSLVNGNRGAAAATTPPRPSHSALVSSIERDLQDIMDSLVLEEDGRATKQPPGSTATPPSSMVNGKAGRPVLSPPQSPGAMSVSSSYENTSPPFSPLSSPASSSSCASHSPGSLDQGLTTPPVVPVRSSSYNHSMLALHAGPRPDLSSGLGGPSSPRGPGSPRMARRTGHEGSRSPPPGCRALPSAESPHPGQQSSPQPTLLVGSNEGASGSPRAQPPGSPHLAPKFQPNSASRTKKAVLQERPPSPFREASVSPSRQAAGKDCLMAETVGLGQIGQPGRALQPPESPRLSRRPLESSRDLPPLSPALSRRAASPAAHSSPSPPARIAKNPTAWRRGWSDDLPPATAPSLRGRSSSPILFAGEPAQRKPGSGTGLSPAYSLGSLTGSSVSPHQSPRVHRKLSGELPGPMRERKQSISELSRNEGDLLEYHRWQRQERLREQEMERLERQRLETILSLCAEYTRSDADMGPEHHPNPSTAEAATPARGQPSKGSGTLGHSREHLAGPQGKASLEHTEDDPLTEESSSTESAGHEHEEPPSTSIMQEAALLEEERVQVLATIDRLKNRAKELEQQMQETAREAEMERALLQGEREAELVQLQQEQKRVQQLQERLLGLDATIQRDKERAKVDAERKELQRLRTLYTELERQLDNCPESLREQLQDQVQREAEALEVETKLFEDLEFQQLEKESRLEEEREVLSQQLLLSQGENHRSLVHRKERIAVLESHAEQVRLQAAQEAERLGREKSATLQLLRKEKENLLVLERRYRVLTGASGFPKASPTLREYVTTDQLAEILGSVRAAVGLPHPLDSPTADSAASVLPALLFSSSTQARTDSTSASLPWLKGGSSSPQRSVATRGCNPSPKDLVPSQNGTGSLPRNLASTLQDIESKRQLALQQKAPAEQMPGSSRRWRRCCGRPMQRSLAWWSHRSRRWKCGAWPWKTSSSGVSNWNGGCETRLCGGTSWWRRRSRCARSSLPRCVCGGGNWQQNTYPPGPRKGGWGKIVDSSACGAAFISQTGGSDPFLEE